MRRWASLFSGGKDSTYALLSALESGREVGRLVTVHPPEGSYLYHVPGTELAGLAAESIGIPLLEVEGTGLPGPGVDSGAQGDRELAPLETAVAELADEVDLAGLTAGAVGSEYQASRLRAMCDRLGIELYAPLWGERPRALADAMLEAGLEIVVVQVAADGLDRSWLGRRLDAAAFDDLADLAERRGVHPLGEGGEFETIVTDGPHMDCRLGFTAEVEWAGDRGRLVVTDAWLE